MVTYRYSKVSLFLHVLTVVLFFVLAMMKMDITLRVISGAAGLLLFKDLFHCIGAEFIIDETGLLERSKFKQKYKMRWDNLKIISKTMANRRWIMLRGEDRQYYMIRPHIAYYEALARDLILYMHEHKIKGVQIHEDVLKRLSLNTIKLNAQGYMKFNSGQKSPTS